MRIVVPGHNALYANPAPGYDDHIPHDLVHYLVEAELQLRAGVFGRAAQGGSSFFMATDGANARERSREQRRQRKREAGLNKRDAEKSGDMVRAERMALLCDVAWRRRHGQRGDSTPWLAPAPPSAEEAPLVERIVSKLEEAAQRWSRLPVGGKLSFVWPSVQPID